MTLREAIEEVKLNSHDTPYSADEVRIGGICDGLDEAIATILNAVVKGELVSREVNADRKAILNRYAMRNGHNSQMPDESREDFNLRVHGLREEDFE